MIYDIFITYALVDKIKSISKIKESFKEEVVYWGDIPENYYIEP